jgi:hypothetical protein
VPSLGLDVLSRAASLQQPFFADLDRPHQHLHRGNSSTAGGIPVRLPVAEGRQQAPLAEQQQQQEGLEPVAEEPLAAAEQTVQ